MLLAVFYSNSAWCQITLVKEIGESISPKSIVYNGAGLFAAQNMMYRHTITFYNAKGKLVKSLKDHVNLHQLGFDTYQDRTYLGSPVEACFTNDGKYLWVSNYAMYGPEFKKEGCDGCSGKNYDPSFLYKVNTSSFEIESIIEVGSVPKFVAVSPNGKLLIVSNWTSSDISIISLKTEKEIKRVDVGARPRGVVIDNKNQLAYVAIMGSDKIAKVNLLNYNVSYIQKVGKGPRHLILNKDNTLLYVALNNINKLLKINLLTGERTYCTVNAGPRTMVMSADEKLLYVVNYYANTFQKVGADSFTVLETIKTKHHPIGITGNWKSNELWVACYSGVIQIFRDGEKSISKINEPEIKTVEVDEKEAVMVAIKKAPKLKGAVQKMDIMAVTMPVKARKVLDEVNIVSSMPCQYHLIVGSFKESNNALAYKKTLISQGYDAIILKSHKNNLNLVSIAQHEGLTAAEKDKADYKKNQGKSSWIYLEECK